VGGASERELLWRRLPVAWENHIERKLPVSSGSGPEPRGCWAEKRAVDDGILRNIVMIVSRCGSVDGQRGSRSCFEREETLTEGCSKRGAVHMKSLDARHGHPEHENVVQEEGEGRFACRG